MRHFITENDLKLRSRLQAAIDRRDTERGRPLTEAEKLENLRRLMGKDDGE